MNETNLIERLQSNIRKPNIINCNDTPSFEEYTEEVRKSINWESLLEETKQDYEMVNHPKHYNNYDVEVVDMMEKIWGTKATMEWCKMTAYKYRMRMGTKPGDNDTKEAMKNKLLEDFNKEQWYLKKADELKSKLFDKSIDMNQ
jgi:hypothetical protein